jgi:hypothetical protein
MRSFSIKTRGLDSVLRNHQRLSKQKVQQVDDLLEQAAREVYNEAKSKAKGSVAASMFIDTSLNMRKKVGNTSPIAAYVEFGTGKNVFKGASYSHTSEERKFARLFYVSGKGTTKSHPFIFPAFRRVITDLPGKIKRVLGIGS